MNDNSAVAANTHPGPRFGLEDVTPALAREWLKHRVQGNCPINPARVEKLRQDIERNGYNSREAIVFDAAGALLDGQHRVTAISLIPDGFAARALVQRGGAVRLTLVSREYSAAWSTTMNDETSRGLDGLRRFAEALARPEARGLVPFLLEELRRRGLIDSAGRYVP